MIHAITAALFAALLAGPAFAEAPAAADDTEKNAPERVRYESSWERIQGAPTVRAERRRAASVHPTQGATAGEAAMEFIPQATYLLEGRYGIGLGRF